MNPTTTMILAQLCLSASVVCENVMLRLALMCITVPFFGWALIRYCEMTK